MKKVVLVSLMIILISLTIAWWQGNQPTAYYQFEGTLEDNSTNGYDLTAVGTEAYGTGKLGNDARYYDGTDYDWVSDATDFTLGTGTYTIALWFNSSSLATNDELFFINGSNDLGLRESSGNLIFRQDTGAASSICNFGAVADWANESWHRIVIVRDGTGANAVRCYADNRNVVNGTNSDDLDGDGLFLGSGFNRANFTGHIDDFIFYKGVAWTVSDVTYDWNDGSGRNASDTKGFTEVSHTYNATTFETETESFIMNITYNSTFYTGISGKLNYDGTEYSATILGTGDNVSLVRTIGVPSSPGAKDFFLECFFN